MRDHTAPSTGDVSQYFLSSHSHVHNKILGKADMVTPIVAVGKQRHRELKSPTQGHNESMEELRS